MDDSTKIVLGIIAMGIFILGALGNLFGANGPQCQQLAWQALGLMALFFTGWAFIAKHDNANGLLGAAVGIMSIVTVLSLLIGFWVVIMAAGCTA